jgi:GlpG protein
MMWLVVLGKQMESRLGAFRYILFIIIVGIISNTAQYIMSGPNFIGFSGVLTGMLSFIWVRQRKAPWEGYQLDKATVIFMLIFIFGMAALGMVTFLLQIFFNINLGTNLANTAHVIGILMGFLLGQLPVFGRRYA